MNYYIATDRFGNYDLEHGIKWRQHKYIRKEGNRYIYPEDLKKGDNSKSKSNSNSGSSSSIDSEYQRALASNSRPNVYPNSDVSKAKQLAQERGYDRTKYYKSAGVDSRRMTSHNNGNPKYSTEYTRPRLEREFEQNSYQRNADRTAEANKRKAEEAARQTQERGMRSTARYKSQYYQVTQGSADKARLYRNVMDDEHRGRKRTGKELQRKNDLLNVVDKYQKQGWTRTFRESEKTHHPEAYNSWHNNAQQELNARAARHAVEYYDKKKKKEHPVQYYVDKGKNWLKNLLKKK